MTRKQILGTFALLEASLVILDLWLMYRESKGAF